ncbi:heterokaryon incompatibility protein-domain-containing protein [Collybia nuda]|uniref:Heterokaryon incompatibility protein-domain-containing protein n=1 Tax=Collybia nuda TaxID=64659 RepID=A0A9P6CCC4_9AGAR|nr:heterokaryon incompatibility protein-domain-containing protein [Collybia nuda]
MQEDIDTEMVICRRCWESTFSNKPFRAIWEGSAEGIRLHNQSRYRQDLYGSVLTYRTPPWAEILESAEGHCGYCTLLRTLIRDARDSSALPTEPPAHEISTITMMFDLESMSQKIVIIVWMEGALIVSEIRIYTEPEDPASRYIRDRNVVWQVNDDVSYDLVSKCVDICSKHEHCPLPALSTLPTRVLDCSDPSHLRLITTNPSTKDFFATLSYVWGGPQLHCTTTKNINMYHSIIDPAKVPKTVSDAIIVTRRLGLRYLWVDSFCIIQDSDEDKAQELSRMRLIFRNAFVTILAARANSVGEGFLQDASPEQYFHPIRLPFVCPDGTIGRITATRYGSGGPVEPVDSRGWCLGERVLSPRILVFSTLGLQYECQTARMNINGSPIGLPLAVPRLPDFAFTSQPGQDAEGQLAKSWDTILQQYTACKLTNPEDKLPALSGVAEQFHRLWPQSRYVAGLWTHQFPATLLWGRDIRTARPIVYRAPSWSWAATDGRIVSGGLTGPSDVWDAAPKFVESICEVKDVVIDLQYSGNPYGGVKSGRLVLNASISRAIWNTRDVREPHSLIPDGVSGHEMVVAGWRDMDQRTGRLEPDAMELPEHPVVEVTLIALTKIGVPSPYIIRSGKDDIHGLFLLPAGENEEDGTTLFRRIGKFVMNAEDWLPISRQDIHIV